MKSKTKLSMLLAFMFIGLAAIGQIGPNRADYDRKTLRLINKSINKETQNLKKRGFAPEVGAPAMEFQLRRAFQFEFDVDEDGHPNYVIASGSAIGGIENIAALHALTDATINAAVKIENTLFGLIESDYNNKLYSRDEFNSLAEMKGVFSQLLSRRLTNAIPLATFVNDHKKHYEVQVRIAYSRQAIIEEAKEVVRELMRKENNALREKMERITGFDSIR